MIGSKAATRLELEHMGRCKRGPCMACLVGLALGIIEPEWVQRGGESADGHDLAMMEFNHCKSGNMRRGHLEGFALCLWHHHGSQQLYRLGVDRRTAEARWGPSMFDQGKRFREVFGSDDDLIEAQRLTLEHAASGL